MSFDFIYGNEKLTYVIDGKTISATKQTILEVVDINNIRCVQVLKYVVEYINCKTMEKMSICDYQEKVGKAKDDSENDPHNLDLEYTYKKLKQEWQPVQSEEYRVSEPIKVNIIEEINTSENNDYMFPVYFSNGKLSGSYKFTPKNFLIDTIKKWCGKNGFNFITNNDVYWKKKETENTKSFYINTEKSTNKMDVAFLGNHIEFVYSGETLVNKKELEEYTTRLGKTITDKLNHIINVNSERNIDVKTIYPKLVNLKDNIARIDSKLKSNSYKKCSLTILDEIIRNVEGVDNEI